jgi:hypothetical protein
VKTKHIIHFTKWVDFTKIYESQESDAMGSQWPTEYLDKSAFDKLSQDFTFTEVKNVLEQINSIIIKKITDNTYSLSTRDIADWLNVMIILYKLAKTEGKFAGLVFNYISPVLTKHFQAIKNFFSGSNKDLTAVDRDSAKEFRVFSDIEAKYIRSVDEKLKSLGLV